MSKLYFNCNKKRFTDRVLLVVGNQNAVNFLRVHSRQVT